MEHNGYEGNIQEMEVLQSKAEPRSYLAVDINGLKEVNDTFGHEAGDQLIIGAANCIERAFGDYGKVFRTGGDEFIVLLTEDIPDEVIG